MRTVSSAGLSVGLVVGIAAGFNLAALADSNPMMLTPAGASEFTLSTFVDGFPTFQSVVGPLGITFPTSGGVMVTDFSGNVRVFATDTDGQLASAGAIGQNYGISNAVGLASSNGNIYLTQQGAGILAQLNNNGTLNHVLPGSYPAATGIATNPVDGTIYVSTIGNNVIFKVNPITQVQTPFVNAIADGLAVSGDGKTLYAAVNNNRILGFDTTTGAEVFDSGPINGGPDGTAIGTFGNLAGKLFVNTNAGQVVEIDTTTLAQTVLATGGTRGDFITVDPLNHTLLITQTDDILRLTPFNVPGPVAGAGMPGLLAAFGGLLGWWRRRTRLIAREILARPPSCP